MIHNANSAIVILVLTLSLSGVADVARSDDTQRRGKPQDITFDDIKFEMKKGTPFKRKMLTKKVVALDEKPVTIRGYILPGFQQKGITQFVLVRDNMECCFGPGAALYDCILVEMVKGTTASFTVRPVSVTGKFTISEFEDFEGNTLAIYRIDGEAVK